MFLIIDTAKVGAKKAPTEETDESGMLWND